jgi:hypothetical protein
MPAGHDSAILLWTILPVEGLLVTYFLGAVKYPDSNPDTKME